MFFEIRGQFLVNFRHKKSKKTRKTRFFLCFFWKKRKCAKRVFFAHIKNEFVNKTIISPVLAVLGVFGISGFWRQKPFIMGKTGFLPKNTLCFFVFFWKKCRFLAVFRVFCIFEIYFLFKILTGINPGFSKKGVFSKIMKKNVRILKNRVEKGSKRAKNRPFSKSVRKLVSFFSIKTWKNAFF